MTDDYISQWVDALMGGPSVDGAVTTAATIGGERYEFDGLHKALARRVVELERIATTHANGIQKADRP